MRITIAILFSLFFFQPAGAQRLLHPPEVGTWGRYKLNGGIFFGKSELYLAVVKEDFIEGKRHLWYEFTAIGDEDTTTMRILVLASPVLDLKALKTVIKIGDGQVGACFSGRVGSNRWI
ncbi:hypothetical protein ACFL5K_03840 [Gemmatimonadota bacterium]